jgi:DNA-binding protein
LNYLREEEKLQRNLRANKAQEIQDTMSKNSKYNKYVTNFNKETGEISINWAEIDKIKDSEKGKAIADYVSSLEKLRDQWREADVKIDDVQQTTEELLE